MKVLVTGGAGFIASHVADGYRARGHEVAIVDNLSRGKKQNLNPGTPFYQADIRDRAALEEVFRKEKPDLVNHHAAQIDVRHSVSDPLFDASANILGSLNLLELALAPQSGVRRFIYASTGGAIYGEPEKLPATEVTPPRPLAPYGVSKHAFELYLGTMGRLHSLPFVVLRYGNVYGPRQNSKSEAGVVAIFSEQLLAGVTPTIYGDGTKTRDYIEVSDVVRANLAALSKGDGEVFNIASGQPTSDYEIFRAVEGALGLSGIEPRYAAKRPGEVDHIFLDIGKAASELGWKPAVTLEEGIRRTAEWFRAQHRRG
jgi:UDP-glucose 4-epimerase